MNIVKKIVGIWNLTDCVWSGLAAIVALVWAFASVLEAGSEGGGWLLIIFAIGGGMIGVVVVPWFILNLLTFIGVLRGWKNTGKSPVVSALSIISGIVGACGSALAWVFVKNLDEIDGIGIVTVLFTVFVLLQILKLLLSILGAILG